MTWDNQGHADVPPLKADMATVTQIDNGIKDHPQPKFPDMSQNYVQMVQEQKDCEAQGGTPQGLHCEFPPPQPVVQVSPDKSFYYQLAVENGWAGYWNSIDAIITRESGWNIYAVNPSSGACGLGQALPCSKLGSAYGSPAGEFTWTVQYMFERYGNPDNAWAFWQAHSWY